MPHRNFRTFYLYTLSDPETNKIYYVGQTENPGKRLARHCYRPGDMAVGNPFLAEWLFRLSEKGLRPKMTVVDSVVGNIAANQREGELIKEYWHAGHPVMNICKGVSTVYERRERFNQGCQGA